MTLHLTGSITALITPLCNGRIDADAYQNFINWQIEQGTSAVVAGGTTGESATMSDQDMSALFHLAVEVANGRIPVIAGCGSPSTAHAIHLSHLAQDAGVDGLLQVSPYYNRPSQDGLRAHFQAIHDATDLPIILYDIPARAGVKLSDPLIDELMDLPRITGLKDCSGDATRAARMSRHFNILSGDDSAVMDYLKGGAHGCISVTANIAPAQCAALHEAWRNHDVITAHNIDTLLQPLHTAMFADSSPGPVKYAASALGLCRNELRLPMVPVNAAVQRQVDSAMQSAGLLQKPRALAIAG